MRKHIALGSLCMIGLMTLAACTPSKTDQTMMKKDEPAVNKQEMMKEGDDKDVIMDKSGESQEMMKKDEPVKKTTTSTTQSRGAYKTYATSDYSLAKNGGKLVLFFHASWCPTCRTTDESIKNGIAALPKNVTISLVDYDSHQDLRKKYGVLAQHTFVQVDDMGSLLSMWSGSNNVEDIIGKLK